jgi:putative tricarboxylic transport membrane protein
VGLLLALASLRFQVWGDMGPKEGFYPLVIGVVIAGLSTLIIVQGLRAGKGNGKPAKPAQAEEKTTGRALLYVAAVLCYGLLFEKAGFLLTSGLFLLIVLGFVERQRWKVTVVVGVISIVVSYFLFCYLLGVPLPKGFMEKW